MTQAAIHGASGSPLPKVHHIGETTSTLDFAFDLVNQGMLEEWDSVLAESQTAGRGQMRKKWLSPPGNLYAALRVPQRAPFDSTASSIALGALIANALSSFGCRIYLKWPNDLILIKEGAHAKLGGILLEERQGRSVAGIGINMNIAPREIVDEGEGLPPGSLLDACPEDLPGPAELWRTLVRHVYSVYKSGAFYSHIWKNLAEEMLLWRGQPVVISDGDESVTGILAGIDDDGAAIIESGGKRERKLGGSMRQIGNA